MTLSVPPVNLASDNVTGCCPEVSHALAAAAGGAALPYGADPWTAQATESLRDLFEKPDLCVLPVLTGTAANALALSCLCPPHGAILCHAESHAHVDEGGAPELLTGGAKLLPIDGPHGKVSVEAVERHATFAALRPVHRPTARVLTITNSTEYGTLYTPQEVAELAAVCGRHGMALHMDGARFANAVAALGCSPADLTWRAGVQALSFGATKNGAWAAEAVIFFDPAVAEQAEAVLRRKRAGQLLSKGRFLGIQLEALLQDGLWLRHAAHANAMAARLAAILATVPGVSLPVPVQANAVFAEIPPALQDRLTAAGIVTAFWPDLSPTTRRFVCSFATTAEDIDRVAAALLEG